MAEARAIHSRCAIVGEPTSLRPMRAGKGYCLAEIRLKAGSAQRLPALGSSAVFAAARLIADIERIAGSWESGRTPRVLTPRTLHSMLV